jgi:hypothetical protein
MLESHNGVSMEQSIIDDKIFQSVLEISNFPRFPSVQLWKP